MPPRPAAPSAPSFITPDQVSFYYAVPISTVVNAKDGSVEILVPPSMLNRMATLVQGNSADESSLAAFETALIGKPDTPHTIQLTGDSRYTLVIKSAGNTVALVTGTGKSLDVIPRRRCCPKESVPHAYLKLALDQRLPPLKPVEFSKPEDNEVVVDGWLIVAYGKVVAAMPWMNSGSVATDGKHNGAHEPRRRRDWNSDKIDVDGDGVDDFVSTKGCRDQGCECIFANLNGSWMPIAYDEDGPGCEDGC